MATTPQDLENIFQYHPPTPGQQDRYEQLREAGKRFATLIYEFVPDSPEKEKAFSKIRGAVMWANAGIACNEKVPRKP